MNVIVTAHLTRESKNTIEGGDENSRDPNQQAIARSVEARKSWFGPRATDRRRIQTAG
jgi:hypothetical protein